MDRREMGRGLDEWIATTYASAKRSRRLPSGRNALKSYVVEADASDIGDSPDGVARFFGSADLPLPVEVATTNDPTLAILFVGRDRVQFFLDTLDTRYWILHTTAPADAADRAIRTLVQRTRLLDSTWLPTEKMELWAGELGIPRALTTKFSVPAGLYREGIPEDDPQDESLYLRVASLTDARVRLDQFRQSPFQAPSLAVWSARIARRDADRDLVVFDDLTAVGKLTCRGNSFRLHQELVLGVKNRYADMIGEWERTYRLKWEPTKTGALPAGEVAELDLPEPLEDSAAEELLSVMFACGEPYRLYGAPIRQGAGRYVVRGVDLHTGDNLDFELLPDVLRAYLQPTTCGNVLARLLTNLQHYHDARVRLR